MVQQRVAGEDAGAELALVGQFRDGLLDGEVARRRRLGDLDAAVGARGRLVAQPRVREQVSEAGSTH